MPGEVLKLADRNVWVTNQPMSEVAALAVFLDWHLQHRAFDKTFPYAQVQIVPMRDQKESHSDAHSNLEGATAFSAVPLGLPFS